MDQNGEAPHRRPPKICRLSTHGNPFSSVPAQLPALDIGEASKKNVFEIPESFKVCLKFLSLFVTTIDEYVFD